MSKAETARNIASKHAIIYISELRTQLQKQGIDMTPSKIKQAIQRGSFFINSNGCIFNRKKMYTRQ